MLKPNSFEREPFLQPRTMATEQTPDSDNKLEDVNLELYSNMNGTKYSRESPSTFGDNHVPSSTATYTNTNTTNELKEEEEKGQIVRNINDGDTPNSDNNHHHDHNHNHNHNHNHDNNKFSNQIDSPFGNLAPKAEFLDINEEEDDETPLHKYSESNNNTFDDDIDDGSFDIWCFCFFFSSRRLPDCINQPLITIKTKNDLKSKNQRHLGVCRYITQTIIIWILVSLYFGFCLFIIFASIEECITDNVDNNINQKWETCTIHSYTTPLCTITDNNINNTYQLWHINIKNSTNCPLLDNNKTFTISNRVIDFK